MNPPFDPADPRHNIAAIHMTISLAANGPVDWNSLFGDMSTNTHVLSNLASVYAAILKADVSLIRNIYRRGDGPDDDPIHSFVKLGMIIGFTAARLGQVDPQKLQAEWEQALGSLSAQKGVLPCQY